MSWDIGVMLWRIGDILDLDAQLDWARDAGFEAIAFHASPGVPGQWRGVDPAVTGRTERRRLRGRLAEFSMCEIHAPFAAALSPQEPFAAVRQLTPIIEFSGDVEASVITVHPRAANRVPEEHGDRWQEALDRLDAMAEKAGVVIAFETLEDFEGFDWVKSPRRPHLGVNLDVGHVCLGNSPAYRSCGTIGALVRSLGETLVHMHVHDCRPGGPNHIEVGTGSVDFADLLRILQEIQYQGAMVLELNPDRVSPEAILRSRRWLKSKMRGLCTG